LKILIIHNILWAHYKSVLFEEIEKQLPSEHEFHLLQIARNEISRKKMESADSNYSYNYTLLFDDYIENVPKLSEITAVLKFFLKYNPDVVNVTGYSASISTLPVIFLAKILGKKIIMSNESTDSDKRKGGLKESIKRWAVKACSGYVVFGKSSEDYLVKLGAKRDRVLVKNAAVVDNKTIESVYHTALQQSLFPEIKTEKNFIFVGRISKEKNVSMLVRAFQSIKEKQPNWGLIIVGNGQDDTNVNLQIQENSENIYKYNSVGWKEIPKFFSKSDCLVLPSSSEPWGLVVNEAMICGLAVIVTEACGCADDLVNGNGYVVKTNSENDLQSALEAIINHTELATLKSKSKEIIKDFSVEKVAKEYVTQITALS
jgi:glycosyltransferase involved in cell wall biosynthesis